MDGKDEAIKRTGQEDALKRDETDVEGHRRAPFSPDDVPGSEGATKRTPSATDEDDVEGHRVPRY